MAVGRPDIPALSFPADKQPEQAQQVSDIAQTGLSGTQENAQEIGKGKKR